MYFMHLISLYFIHAKHKPYFLLSYLKKCFDILIILYICIFMMSIYYDNMILFKEYASEFESYKNIAPEWYFYYTQTHLMVRFTTVTALFIYMYTVLFRYCIEIRFSATQFREPVNLFCDCLGPGQFEPFYTMVTVIQINMCIMKTLCIICYQFFDWQNEVYY